MLQQCSADIFILIQGVGSQMELSYISAEDLGVASSIWGVLAVALPLQ
jgi:hypothetical protein